MRTPVVAHIVQHLRPGGIESLVLEMLRAGTPGVRQIAVSLDGEAAAAMAAWPRLAPLADRLHFLAKPAGRCPSLPLRLSRLLRAEGVTVVQTHHIGPLLYGGLAARLAGARLVHVEHDAWHLDEPARRRLARGLVGTLRPRLAAVSHTVAERAGVALAGRLRVIPNAVDLDRFRPADRAAARAALELPAGPLLACAARLEPVKGVDVLIDALTRLPPAVTLAVAGEGSAATALAAQAARVAPGRVRFLGRIEAMPALYAAADLTVLPSRAEGLPLSLLEAQAAGCPVVATAVGGVPGAVDPATGRLVPPDDPAALAAAIAETLARPAGSSPRAFVAARHALPDMMAAYARLWSDAA
jgi:glycosyltransferase involved in cell wall biosynthesis